MPAAKVSKDRFDRLFNSGSRWRKIAGSRRRGLCEHDSFGCLHPPEQTPKGMCPCFDDIATLKDPNANLAVDPHSDFKSKPRRLECPFCKRRVFGRSIFGHDGDYRIYALPVHKPKGWWKKGKPRKVRR
jgi:hypothetical protein